MIKKLRVRNFKAFEDTGYIDLAPMTVLAGPNSGGKSSILQSLLLLKQTLQREEDYIELSLDGKYIQVSSLRDLTFRKPPLDECRLRFGLELESRIPAQVVPRYYPSVRVPPNARDLPLCTRLNLSFRHRERRGVRTPVVMDGFAMESSVMNEAGPKLSIALSESGYQINMKGVSLPDDYQGWEITGMGGRYFLPAFLYARPSGQDEPRPQLMLLDQIFRKPLDDLESELRDNLRYLGPLRDWPERAYMRAGSPSGEMGPRGENAAELLWLEKDSEVQYLDDWKGELEQRGLLESVREVLGKQFGVAETIDVSTAEDVIYRILFSLAKGGEETVTIADVGFGVSQLLPIVIMGLRAPMGSLVVFEQPEIHLHPKLQASLGDFFLSLISLNKRVLLETHSDHLINRIRRRIAEDTTDRLKDMISILFVRPPREGKGARIEPLRVNRYGVIDNWPPDFLPESANESELILKAGMQKRMDESR